MKRNSGQALVEFILVLPVLLIILLGIVDFANIIQSKYKLESNLDTAVDLYRQNRTIELKKYLLDEKLTIDYEVDNTFTKVILKKKIDIITPGLNVALNDPYEISVERVIYSE